MGGEPESSRTAPARGRSQHTLAARLEAEGALAPDEVASLAATIAAELAECHERGEVVGAVRPDSIVLTGGVDTARLAPDGWRAGLYRSPEQVEGAPAGPSSDVYNLGVVVLHALTGHAPRPNGRAATMADFPDALSAVPSHLDRRWQWVLQGMTTRSARVRMSAPLAAASFMDLERRARRRSALSPDVAVAGALTDQVEVTTPGGDEAREASVAAAVVRPLDRRQSLLKRPVAVAAVGLVLVLMAGALTARMAGTGSSSDGDVVVVDELASRDTISTLPTTTTSTVAPATDPSAEQPILVLDPNDLGEAVPLFGVSLGGGPTRFRPLSFALTDGDDAPPTFAFIPPSTSAPSPIFSPTPTPSPSGPTTTRTPVTTAPPTTPPTTPPPTTTQPPPTTTTPPPTTTEPPPTTTVPPPTTTAPPLLPLPLPLPGLG